MSEVYPYQAEAVTSGLSFDPGAVSPPVSRRLDSILSWHGAQGNTDSISDIPFTARWRGKFVAASAGNYLFEAFNTNDCAIWLDGRQVALNTGLEPRAPKPLGSELYLAKGEHDIEIRYNWTNGWSIMDVLVTPPDGERVVANGSMFRPVTGVWLPGEVPDPAPATVTLDRKP